jgi:hypothetical protein
MRWGAQAIWCRDHWPLCRACMIVRRIFYLTIGRTIGLSPTFIFRGGIPARRRKRRA